LSIVLANKRERRFFFGELTNLYKLNEDTISAPSVVPEDDSISAPSVVLGEGGISALPVVSGEEGISAPSV
jgi:hypothetical protein